jgi:hypothetical protein
MRDGDPTFFDLAIIAIVIASWLTGCGSAFQTQTTAIELTATALDVASDIATEHLNAEQQACPTPECMDAVRVAYEPLVLAGASVFAALVAWADMLQLAMVIGRADGVAWRAAIRSIESVANAWESMRLAAEPHGFEIPALPVVDLGGQQ